MSQVTYRANLSAKSFPFLSENFGQSIIVPGQDQNFVRTAYSAEDLDKDKGVPQIYYCHNVMPHQEGLQSVGYKQLLPSASATGFSSIFLLRDDSDNKAFLGVRNTGSGNQFYISDGSGGAWVPNIIFAPGLVTVAYVAGVTYIYVENSLCVQYNFITGVFDGVTLKGLNGNVVTGICPAAGYLIAWCKGVPAKTLTVPAASSGDYKVFVSSVANLTVGAGITGVGIPPDTSIYAIYKPTDGGPAVYLTNALTSNVAAATWTIAANTSIVSWSSTTDPTDFIPSPVTGAGGGPIESAKGSINLCIPHTLGFIIGTADNCIAALFQNNSLFPFQFRELVNSGGMTSLDLVTWDANSSGLYAYTTSGLQLISTQQTQTVNTEITDFISGSNFEDFNDITKVFTQTQLTTPMAKKITVVADRYLVISYGVASLTHAIVLDLITKRYGKLKVPHTQCFTYHLATAGIQETPRQSFAFLQDNGSVLRVDFDIASTSANGTLLTGKYQYVRARNLVLDTIQFESIRAGQTFVLSLLTALDGKNNSISSPYLAYSNGLAREYACRAEGKNHSLLFQGGFLADSLVLQFHVGAKR